MKSYRTPNWVMKDSYTYSVGTMDTRTISAGSFVRPVEHCYVPKHVLEDKRWNHYNSEKHIFIYHRYGFVMVPKDSVRET
jgi:hypothetical protein